MRVSWTWRHAILQSELPPTTRHVLLTISCFMNEMGQGAYPTTKKLEEATGLSERAVCTHIQNAVDAGWLVKRVHGFRGQKWKNNEYEANWPVNKGTERGSVRTCEGTEPDAEGTEPNDIKALNEVQSKVSYKHSNKVSSPYNPPEGEKGVSQKSDEKDLSKKENKSLPLQSPEEILTQTVNEETSKEIIQYRKKIKKPLTARAAKSIAKELAKCPDPESAVDEWFNRGWQGFKAEWLEEKPGKRNGPDRSGVDALREYGRALREKADSIPDPFDQIAIGSPTRSLT